MSALHGAIRLARRQGELWEVVDTTNGVIRLRVSPARALEATYPVVELTLRAPHGIGSNLCEAARMRLAEKLRDQVDHMRREALTDRERRQREHSRFWRRAVRWLRSKIND